MKRRGISETRFMAPPVVISPSLCPHAWRYRCLMDAASAMARSAAAVSMQFALHKNLSPVRLSADARLYRMQNAP